MSWIYGYVDFMVGFSAQSWSIYEGLGFSVPLVCMFAELGWEVSAVDPVEIFEILAYSRGKEWRYGHMELTAGFSLQLCSIDKRLGGSQCVAVYVDHLNESVPHSKLAKFRHFCMFHKECMEIWPRRVDG
jgi:hypothetical protein